MIINKKKKNVIIKIKRKIKKNIKNYINTIRFIKNDKKNL